MQCALAYVPVKENTVGKCHELHAEDPSVANSEAWQCRRSRPVFAIPGCKQAVTN